MNMLDCGEVSCEYCSKDKCIYMTDNEVENKAENIELVIKIPKEIYKNIQSGTFWLNSGLTLSNAYDFIKNGIPLEQIKAEIDQIEINGHIRDTECFSAGINAALNVINKYKA